MLLTVIMTGMVLGDGVLTPCISGKLGLLDAWCWWNRTNSLVLSAAPSFNVV